jgi:hypothetical protein
MNAVSSRSHAVFTIAIEQIATHPATGSVTRKRSKIHLIDLAGSERADSTGASGARLREGSAINQSLSALGNVISALSDAKTRGGHVPYRDSKLTYLLSDSLGGNSLTLMIACVTPLERYAAESLSTLRFAERAKRVQNVARLNMDPASLRILKLEAEVQRLRGLLGLGPGGEVVHTTTQTRRTLGQWLRALFRPRRPRPLGGGGEGEQPAAPVPARASAAKGKVAPAPASAPDAGGIREVEHPQLNRRLAPRPDRGEAAGRKVLPGDAATEAPAAAGGKAGPPAQPRVVRSSAAGGGEDPGRPPRPPAGDAATGRRVG